VRVPYDPIQRWEDDGGAVAVIGAPRDRIAEPPVLVDLASHGGSGTLWGVATHDLNATLLTQEAGAATQEHVNDELDVLLVILAGSATVVVDGEALDARAGHLAIIPKGRSRRLVSGPEGVRYLSVHRRRMLQIRTRPR
jgi:quercetin dioxygenase-like cupin family protein